MYIPESIRMHLPDADYIPDTIGASGATVLQYADRVLKIETDTPVSAREHTMMRWLQGKLRVPEIIAEEYAEGKRYLLMSRLPGHYLCDERFLDDQARLAEAVAKALRQLWSVDVSDCPCPRTLDVKFAEIEQALHEGSISTEYAQPDTYGPGGFDSPAQLFDWIVAHRPADEELALSHGDFCLPNLFMDETGIPGFIDLGNTGAADPWLDIDKGLWSMWANTTGVFGGKKRAFDRQLLFDALGMEPDEEKLRYYALLDDLC